MFCTISVACLTHLLQWSYNVFLGFQPKQCSAPAGLQGKHFVAPGCHHFPQGLHLAFKV